MRHTHTEDTLALRDYWNNRHSTDGCKLPTLAGGHLKLYVAELCFNNVSDEQEKEYSNNLLTSFKLNEPELGGCLLVEHPEYKKFMREYQ